jgi:hypothetical protein
MLIRFLGAVSRKPVWINPEMVVAVDGQPGNDAVAIVTFAGMSHPTTVTVDGTVDEVGQILSMEP